MTLWSYNASLLLPKMNAAKLSDQSLNRDQGRIQRGDWCDCTPNNLSKQLLKFSMAFHFKASIAATKTSQRTLSWAQILSSVYCSCNTSMVVVSVIMSSCCGIVCQITAITIYVFMDFCMIRMASMLAETVSALSQRQILCENFLTLFRMSQTTLQQCKYPGNSTSLRSNDGYLKVAPYDWYQTRVKKRMVTTFN